MRIIRDNSGESEAAIHAAIERLKRQRIPRLRSLNKQVEQGETLTEFDVAFLAKCYEDIVYCKTIAWKDPHLQKLVMAVNALYQSAYKKALDNDRLYLD